MNVAFIPVRGGSKSIPLKNIKNFCGMPLVYWTIKAAYNCTKIDKIYVATDSEAIKKTVEQFKLDKVRVIERSRETATDTASTESVMLEFAENYSFENIVLIQATSPLLSNQDLEEGFKLYEDERTDSVISVVRQKRFHWGINQGGFAYPLNYDIYNRPRRQNFDGYLVENGAFYITSRNSLLKTRNRISGNIRAYEMCEDSFFEIDEPSDWVIIEELMKKKRRGMVCKLQRIKLVATDCDGVLTDGGMYYSENGDELKKFNTLDGMGFEILRNNGIKTAIISGESNPLLVKRAEKLKVDDIILGEKDKLGAIRELCIKYGVSLEEVAYIGDDIFDIPAIEACGFGCTPDNAMKEVKDKADFVTLRRGGEGCFREMVEKIREEILQ